MSQLNAVDPFEGYETVLRPYLDIPFLKLRGKHISAMEDDSKTDTSAVSDAPLKAEAAFKVLAQAISPDMVKAVGVSYRFDITGAGGKKKSWIVDLKAAGTIVEGSGGADCVIAMSDDDFVNLMTGKLDPMNAFMQGKLKVKGNVMAAQKLSLLTSQRSKL